MSIKQAKIVSCVVMLMGTLTACGLLPNMNSHAPSNKEKGDMFMQMGVRYLEMGKLETAKEKLEMALRYDSRNPDIYNSLGSFHETIKDYVKAESYYQSALQYGPENFIIQSNVGRFYCERKDFDQGMELLQEAIDQPMNDRPWLAYHSIGECYSKQNNFAKAEENLRKALQLQPEFAPSLQEMQKISYEKHQFLSARAFLERFLAVSQQTPDSLWIAYQTERALGNKLTAQLYGEQYLEKFPATPEADLIRTALDK